MIGLPPTQEEIQAFLSDKSPNAWEKVVDRLLASPAYGERWGRHWLDVARYADSNGFKADETRPNVWRYRDYVIKAFNDDKPYDRFVKEQIAGDELYPGNQEALIAMGFNRHWIDETNAPDLFERRHQTLDDMTTVTGVAFLGMTFGCAKCHDHKFDPILTKDYYRLQAFFANTAFGDGPLPLADPEAKRQYDEQYAAWDAKTKDIRDEMAKIMAPILEERKHHSATVMTDEVQAVIAKPAEWRTPLEQQVYHIAQTRFGGLGDPVKSLKAADALRYHMLKAQLAGFDSIKPPPLPEGQFMTDLNATAPPTYILHGGSRLAPGDEVQPGFLSILDPSDAKITPPAGVNSTGRRSALAAWLTDPSNPLPARVMVNRIWHYHFGRGIVATPGDFGKMGARPTHPELLDYLASYFVDNGWSIKKVHRLILLSNAYQEASDYQPKIAEADPDNKLLWHYPRHRMEARSDSRFHAGHGRRAESSGGRSGRVSPGSSGNDLGAFRDGSRRRLANGERSGAKRSPQRLHFCPPQPALPAAAGIRYSQHFRELRLPQEHRYSAAIARPVEQRAGAGLGARSGRPGSQRQRLDAVGAGGSGVSFGLWTGRERGRTKDRRRLSRQAGADHGPAVGRR